MGDFSIAASAALVLRTYPFMLLRFAVYFGVAIAFAVAAGAGAGIGSAVGLLAGPSGRVPGAFWGAVGGVAVIAFIVWWLREYLLYLVKAGHVAAMVFALDGRRPPPGSGQIGQSIDIVQRRFREVGILFLVARLVNGSLRTIVELSPPAALLPHAGAHIPATPANTALHFAVGFLPEVVLARALRSKAGNIWVETRDGLILFAQHHRELMKNALLLAAFAFGISFCAFLLALIPAMRLSAGYPGATVPIAVLLAASFAWSFKQALIEPFAIASMLQIYFGLTDGRQAEPAWDVRLTEASEHFREIKARSVTFVRGPRRTFAG